MRDSIEKTLKKTMARTPTTSSARTRSVVTINKAMHKMDFDDTMSGTTAITAFFNDSEARPGSATAAARRCRRTTRPPRGRARARPRALSARAPSRPPPPRRAQCVANIGDSRAITGERKEARDRVLALDRPDAVPAGRARALQGGGRVVMSCDQLEGPVLFHENWASTSARSSTKATCRACGSPASRPGCAFTRSISDSVAESIGVYAEPELLCKELTPRTSSSSASDGVWEFTNQSVSDMALFSELLEAPRRRRRVVPAKFQYEVVPTTSR